MLAAGVEHVAATGLDHDPEAVAGQQGGHLGGASSELGREGVEVGVVEGERHPVVAEVGEHCERIVRAGGR